MEAANETEQKQTSAWVLELYGGEPSSCQKVELAGVEWWYWHGCTQPEINCHIEEDGGRLRMIKCHQDDKGVFIWGFSLLVAEGQSSVHTAKLKLYCRPQRRRWPMFPKNWNSAGWHFSASRARGKCGRVG